MSTQNNPNDGANREATPSRLAYLEALSTTYDKDWRAVWDEWLEEKKNAEVLSDGILNGPMALRTKRKASELSVAEFKTQSETGDRSWSVKEETVNPFQQGSGPDIPITIISPKTGTDFPCIIFIHGGAFVGSSRFTNLAFNADDFVTKLGAVVVSVEYRRPPTDGNPPEKVGGTAPAQDCASVLGWVWENHASLKIKKDRILLYGASAGGCLAASTMLMLRDNYRGFRDRFPNLKLCGVFLEAPMLDDREQILGRNNEEFRLGPFLTLKEINYAWEALIGSDEDHHHVDIYVVPGQARDVKNVPVCAVGMMLSKKDPFYYEGLAFGTMFKQATKVDFHLYEYEGVPHGFFASKPTAKKSVEFLSNRLDWLRRVISEDIRPGWKSNTEHHSSQDEF